VHVTTGVEVALVDLEPALRLTVLDAYDLDPEVAREAARDPLAEDLRGDRRVAQRSRAVPS
jgi:hypothetical protein